MTLHCDTCGRPIEPGREISRVDLGRTYVFCCHTCESAFEAASFQRQFIPDSFENEWLSFFIDYIPVLRIGGDYAHVKLSSPERLYLLVGDVSGHGITASLLMSRVSTEVERLVSANCGLDEIVTSLDELVARAGGDRLHFLTLFCLLANLRDGTLSFINCGHPPPLLWSSSARRYQRLEPQIPPLGLFHLAPASVKSEQVRVVAGSRLILYTDGLSELELDEEELGEAGIEKVVTDFIQDDSSAGARRVFARVRALPKPQDDVLLALLSFRGEPAG